MELIAHTFGQLYAELLGRLLYEGDTVETRGQLTRELVKVNLRLADPTQNILFHPSRNLNYRFMVAEWLWITFGREDVATITRYNSKIAEFSDDGQTFWGAYGPRFREQWNYVLAKLRADPSSRQALLTLWRPSPGTTRDVPCTVSWQFLIRRRRLHLLATMRSSDIWLGLPYDVFNFTMIQNLTAGVLGLRPGTFYLDLGSSHLYEHDAPRAHDLHAATQLFTTVGSPRLPCFPPDELHQVLVDPAAPSSPLPPPWDRYARALRVRTRAEAWEVLRGA